MLFLPWTCRHSWLSPGHLAFVHGPYLQREGLNGLLFHVVHEHPKECFLFSVCIHSLKGKAQGGRREAQTCPNKEDVCICWISTYSMGYYLLNLSWGSSSSEALSPPCVLFKNPEVLSPE